MGSDVRYIVPLIRLGSLFLPEACGIVNVSIAKAEKKLKSRLKIQNVGQKSGMVPNQILRI